MAALSRFIVSATLALALFLTSLLLPWPHTLRLAEAAGVSDSIKILEITDSGTSDLSSLLREPDYSISSMSMKKFVATRTELEGMYDAVYIGKGKYSPETLPLLDTPKERNENHNTKEKLNDITRLKAQELIDGYVNRGLLVLLYSDNASASGLLHQPAAPGGKPGILKEKFGVYNEAGKRRDNVLFLDNAGLNRVSTTLKQDKYAQMLRLRPKLQLTSGPINYLQTPEPLYQAGDAISFRYEKPERPGIRVNLYLNLDSSLRFLPDQVVASSDAPGASGELSYRMPKGFSGLYYWKLEIVDSSTGLKSYRSGVIRYRDKLTAIRVLQIMPKNDANSSLKKNDVLKQSYLSTNDYAIELTTTDTEAFNTKGGLYGYDSIGGKYDMLIFGFKDSYNANAALSETAAGAVNAFIATGQSVMFTHDTVFIASGTTDNVWTRNFKGSTGQTGIMTNMGLQAPKESTKVAKVNDGLLTRFPFNLDASTPSVASTHNQYFMLNLEDPAIIPWYNITGGTRDENDSWNHYYTYSKGNVTYSGTGHVFKGGSEIFPEWEQKLFVNTMYRAYIGSNHKPELTVYSPTAYSDKEGNFIPSYQQIPINFMAEDPDYKDRRLNAKIDFRYSGPDGKPVVQTMYESGTLLSGTLVAQSFPNPLPNGGDLEVRITTSDKQGASATECIAVRIQSLSPQLQVERSASGTLKDVYVEKGKDFQLHYTVRPQPITGVKGQAGEIVIASPSFTEKLPKNLEVSSLPEGFSKSGTLASGYTITGSLRDIRFIGETVGDKTVYSAEPMQFNLVARAMGAGTLQLNEAALSFRNLGQSTFTRLNFNALTLDAVVKPSLLSLPASVEIARNESYKLLLIKEPQDASDIGLEWTSSNPAGVSLQESVKDGIMIKGLQQGATSVITVTDKLSGLSASSTVRVIEPGLSIETADKARVYTLGSRIGLDALLIKSASESLPPGAQVVWSVEPQSSGEEGIIEKQRKGSLLEWSAGFYPTLPGSYKIRASISVQGISNATDLAETRTYESTALELNVLNPDLLLNGPSVIVAGDSRALWTRDWGNLQPVGVTQRALDYGWSWEPKRGDTSSLRPQPNNPQQMGLKSENPGSGTLAITALQPLRIGAAPIEIAEKGKDIQIIAKPTLAVGNRTLLPGQNTSISLDWGSAATKPPATVSWSITGAGALSGSEAESRQLTASKPASSSGQAVIRAVVTMEETKYSFTIEQSVAVLAPALDIQGLPELVAPNQKLELKASWRDGYNGSLTGLLWQPGGMPSSRAELAADPSNPAKAVFTALSAGAAKASAEIKLSNTYTASAAKNLMIVDFTLPSAITLRQGESLVLKGNGLQILPSNLTEKIAPQISWSSSNAANVAVDTTGKLTAKKLGTATITATYEANSFPGGTIQRKTIVTVKAPEGDRY
ncbi:Ig-like domain (group 2) [Paenibacillaceae bacterium GAS479]|nr:Ig-like domain (group 2) [Paenibacillaceae bacterium GAS479]